MSEQRIWTFFYGSFIDLSIHRVLDVALEKYEPARLSGFDIRVQPLANLIRSDRDCVYGIVALASHDQLRRLYDYAKKELGTVYFPEPVLVETFDGKWRPALCYIAPEMEPRPPSNEYIEHIVEPAKQYGFPDWYIARLEKFCPQTSRG
jgi:hypothetical protein